LDVDATQVAGAIHVNPLAADIVRRRHQIREAGHVADRDDALRTEQFQDPVQIEIVFE
jgi:hypothetical protein